MTGLDFLSYLQSLNIKLWYEEDRLRVEAPLGVLTPDLQQELAERKTEILSFLKIANAKKKAAAAPQLCPVPRDQDLPLSFSQQRLWFLDQLEPNNVAYNLTWFLHILGKLDVDALQQSLNEITRRHEVLRTTFPIEDGQPVQQIAPPGSFGLSFVDLQKKPEPERLVETKRLIAEEAVCPFDLAEGPLFRATLLQLSKDEYFLLVTMHHIVTDGLSIEILKREFEILYESSLIGNPSPLPELPIQYADFGHWQVQSLQGGFFENQLSYWKQRIGESPPPLELPTDFARPAVQSHKGAVQLLDLPHTLSENIVRLSRSENVTLFMTLLAAFETLLYRYTGQEDITIGSPFNNRTRPELENLIGFFVNTLMLRTDLSGTPTFKELLGRVRDVVLGAFEHQDFPFEKLVEMLEPERDLSRNPLFQVFFNMINFDQGDILRDLAGGQIEISEVAQDDLSEAEVASMFDMTLYVNDMPEGINLTLVYNADLFSADRMTELLAQLQYLLSQIVADPDKNIAHYSLVTPTATGYLPNPVQLLDEGEYEPIYNQISRKAQQGPDRLALIDAHERWTYQELEERSNQVAHYLRLQGIQSQDVIAIYSHRSAAMVCAILGVLKAGGAFLVIDPAYPPSRLIQYLQSSGPRGWLQLEAAGELPDDLAEFLSDFNDISRLVLPHTLSQLDLLLSDYSKEDPKVTVDPNDLAYVTFTSGSTGVPKGILTGHKPIAHFVKWHSQTFGFTEGDRFSMLGGLAHDPLLRDIFTPLCLGAALYIPSQENILSPGQLAAWMQEREISITHLTPAVSQLLTQKPDEQGEGGVEPFVLRHLRYAFFGGDVLTSRHVLQLRRMAPSVQCVNFYGTTETPQAMSYLILDELQERFSDKVRDREMQNKLPIGRGIEGAQLLVLNASHQLAGIGEIGEIFIRSPYLAKGYLEDKELTEERYITNPFTGRDNDRLYKTGDLGRYLPGGEVEFLGRIDYQVKIRGFRIELGEIEAILNQHTVVRESVVIAREDETGDKYLVAYLIPSNEEMASVADLREFVGKNLPNYMIPSAFEYLEAFPLTPNRKIDRRALPAPTSMSSELQKNFVAPRNDIEQLVADIMADVLKVERVGVFDNFFELGGHSLLATQVISRINKTLVINLAVRDLFENPTLDGLVQKYTEAQEDKKPGTEKKRRELIL
jgi:amino acid adenylation domain-containing protein